MLPISSRVAAVFTTPREVLGCKNSLSLSHSHTVNLAGSGLASGLTTPCPQAQEPKHLQSLHDKILSLTTAIPLGVYRQQCYSKPKTCLQERQLSVSNAYTLRDKAQHCDNYKQLE